MSSPRELNSTSNIFSLPPELIERTLVLSAACGFPSAIASLSRSCKYFHSVVWQSSDQHLWREIFLTTFDDPRPLLANLRHASSIAEPELLHNRNVQFNWAEEFVLRMSAAKCIRKWTDATPAESESTFIPMSTPQISSTNYRAVSEPKTPPLLLTTLKSLLSVLSTSVPSPSSPRLSCSDTVLPPIVVLYPPPMPLPHCFRSLNAAWVDKTLSRGYPPVLARRLFIPSLRRPPELVNNDVTEQGEGDGFERVKYAEWENTEEGRSFFKLVFLKGFIPIPEEEQANSVIPTSSSEANDHAHDVTGHVPTSNAPSSPRSDISILSTPINPPSFTFPKSADQQMAATRALARGRVYNMRYLMPERCWGPFLPVTTQRIDADGVESRIRGSLATQTEGTSARPINCDARDSALNTIGNEGESSATLSWRERLVESIVDDGEDDGEYHPSDGDEDDSDEDGDGDILHILPLMGGPGIDFSDNRPYETFVLPSPHRVVPDYVFLASARLLIEANLRDTFVEQSSDDDDPSGIKLTLRMAATVFKCTELLRMGGAPEFWKDSWGWGARGGDKNDGEQDVVKEERLSFGDKGKGKARDAEEDVEGWDWAGVAGEWRRIICWMDYRDLLLHNLGSFDLGDNDLQETLRIFPMTLRVSGYSRVPAPCPSDPPPNDGDDLIWKLPIIHVEGESRGSDIDEQTLRYVSGTVRMIGDGAVRWSLTSSHPDREEPEWASEGVQIGSVGSAIGILGMWTGAEHARTDPLGPFWAWKVG